MRETKRYNFKKILAATLWLLCGVGTIVLLGAAMYKKNSHYCKAVEISIAGVKNNFFIDKAGVNIMLEKISFGKLMLRPLNTFDLTGMETFLKKNEWIKSAELYFDNNDVLQINILEREPIARIFNTAGMSFYIDSSLKKLPLSNKFSARLPVFTNFPLTNSKPSKADSLLLNDIKNIGTYILQNPFWMAQIEQIDIRPNGSFDMVPKIGNQLILFGNADNWKEKFSNLLLFYKEVQSKVGWNKYASINVSYKGQVVAVKRGAGDIKLDSLKTLELLKILVANAQKQANESFSSIQLVQPKEDNIIPQAKSQEENFNDVEDVFTDTLPSKQINSKPLIAMPAGNNEGPGAGKITSGENRKLNIPLPSIHSSDTEKPKSIIIKNILLKPGSKKPAVRQERKPKAVMPAENDY